MSHFIASNALWLLVLQLLLLLHPSLAGIKKPTQLPPADLSDIQYIKCDVCKLLAKNAHSTVVRMRRDKGKGKKLAEMEIIEAMEKLTDPLRNEGHWISRIDLQEKGTRLELIDMGKVGECSRECKTIAKAAEQILGEHDTDLAERLLKGKTSRADLQQWLCFDLSNACASPPPPLPADRPKGPGFVAIPAEEVHVVNMMGEMRAKGVRGKLVKPEDVLDRQPGEFDEDDDDMFGMMGGGFPGMYDNIVGDDVPIADDAKQEL